MRSLHRSASHAERAVKSQRITQLLQLQRSKITAARTYDALREFEDHIKTFKTAPIVIDDLPLNATACNMKSTVNTVTLEDNWSEHSDSPRPAHGKKLFRKTSQDSSMCRTLVDTDTDDHLHARRPPSPLAHYDYGCINLKHKSALSQRRTRVGSAPAMRRASSSCGFYFPGPDYRQGPYGFSMQDPILLPQRVWEPSRETKRSDQHTNDCRPRHHKDSGNDGAVRQSYMSKSTCPDLVRSNRAQELKLGRVFQTLDNDREEACLEQTRFEEGNFGGRWCHPVRAKPGAYLNHGPMHHFAWMEQDLSEMGEAGLLASRIVSGITKILQEQHSTMPRLFWAVNRDCPGVLELEDFVEGLRRLRIIPDDENVTIRAMDDAVSLIDPDYDGRVNYPALTRAITAAQNLQRKQAQANTAAVSRGPLAETTNYGAELPVDMVKVDPNSKSVYDFNRSRDTFCKQQKALLAFHGEKHD